MQFVNFYLDEYRPKPLSFDLRFAAAIVSIIVVGLIVIGIIQNQQVADAKVHLAEKQQAAAKLLEETQALQKQLAERKDVQSLEKEITIYQSQLTRYQKAIANLHLADKSESDNFSQVLNALSEKQVDAVWLTQIDIDPKNLSLHGSTTKRSAIPDYVANLKQDIVLNRVFDELTIKENQDNRRLMDFSLLNGRKIDE